MKVQRETFDEVAKLYAKIRPGVRPEVVDALTERLALGPSARVLEVGCGSGQLTVHLARAGARVTALDRGERLLEQCARAVGGFDVALVHSTFEDHDPGAEPFDVVAACQAAHWIDPAVFLDRAAAALRPGGQLALLWHVDTSAGSPFWTATQPLYARYIPDADDRPPRTLPERVATYERALQEDPRFTASPRRDFPWEREFDESSYIHLLRTHSPVRMLDEDTREAFLAGHGDVIRQFGGRVTRSFTTVLIVATLA